MFRDTLNIQIDAKRFIFGGFEHWKNSDRIKKIATKNLLWEKSYPNIRIPNLTFCYVFIGKQWFWRQNR